MANHDPDSRLATRAAFLVSGFGLACRAPLIPFAKARLGLDEGSLGLLLLCLGFGSVAAMRLTAPLTARLGARPAILVGGIGMAVVLPLLALAPTSAALGVSLVAFGGFLGVIEVGMNVHAVEVEKRALEPLMSGFHGLFSVGGFIGSSLMTIALSAHVGALPGVLVASVMMIAILLFVSSRFIQTPKVASTSVFVAPRGIVVLLAALAAITFLTEGAILDWSALLLTGAKLVDPAHAGIGYSIFAIAMTAGRLTGDAVVARLGDRRTLIWGGVIAIAGYLVLVTAPVAVAAMVGLLLIGLGSSNVVPVIFRQAGAQTVMPSAAAIASITMVGYAGILAGPAGIGLVAYHIGLPAAFGILGALLCIVPFTAKMATGAGGHRPVTVTR